MATLGRAKHDGHFFILLGPSKGTRQITDEGIAWLREQGYPLLSDDKIELHRGDYRYLEDKGYLYIEDIDYDKHEVPETPLHDNEVEKEGPSLLLTLDKDHNSSKGIGVPWTLTIKFDELEEQAQRELRRKGATAITTQLPASPYRMLDLHWLHDSHSWPTVSPQSTPYHVYYYNNQGQLFPLKTGVPAQGLQGGWRGNIFLRFEHPQLENTWRRSALCAVYRL